MPFLELSTIASMPAAIRGSQAALSPVLGAPAAPVPWQAMQYMLYLAGGSAWAVLYPDHTLVPIFGNKLREQLVLLIGGNDSALEDYIDTWLIRKQDQGFLQRLYGHWILLEPDDRDDD